MVDRIEQYSRGPVASMQCSRFLSINEPLFAGHFPQVAVFPGAMLLEGLCQTSQLLCSFFLHQQAIEEAGLPAESFLEALDNLEQGFRFAPGFQPEAAQRFFQLMEEGRGEQKLGVTASTQIKFLHPVFAGQKLLYTSTMQKNIGEMWRYQVEAESEGRLVAKGSITAAILEDNLLHLLPPR